MCGIFGYVGPQKASDVCIEGLKRLEYRGYDSAGIAGGLGDDLLVSKDVGKVAVLEKKVKSENLELDYAIAHTRWATHGQPTTVNAHPHVDTKQSVALVHNGIIENHEALKRHLEEKGVTFVTDTDTEVAAQLIADFYDGDILKAVQQAVGMLQGSYAMAVVHKDFPNQVIATASESPLAIGIGTGEVFVASDTNAFLTHTKEVIYLVDGEVSVVTPDNITVYDATSAQVMKKKETLAHQNEEVTKGTYDHYTLKEIFEQPQTIRNALLSRYMEESGNVVLDGLHNFSMEELLGIERILILACGTSWHAGSIAAYFIEEMARIPVQVEISSEFRHKNPIVEEGTFVIAISQSGETADTLAAVKELKAKGAKVLAICNVHGSTLVREAHGCLFLRAGAEIGVCSTKAFTSQLIVLKLFGLLLGRMRDVSKAQGRKLIEAMKQLPDVVSEVLKQSSHIASVAKKYAKYENFFFLGRRYMYPAALEGALKLKEISYINANGYPAGEMKHGPIALINENCPTVALCADKLTLDKMISNLKEVKARRGLVVAIAEGGAEGIDSVADDIITIPKTLDVFSAIPVSVAAQLFAYYVALERGTDIDQPRNLAKSVTVE